MAVPALFPLYPDSLLFGRYKVSFKIQLPESKIAKSVGMTAGAGLLIPNVDYLGKFTEGNLGIGEGIIKNMLSSNFSSPIAARDPKVFKEFARLGKQDVGDINKFKTNNGRYSMPKEQLKLSPEFESTGVIAFEKTTLQSIFETQKPYLEIAKLTIGSIAKIEDIVARVMPLLSISPLSCRSARPSSNPNALGYQNGKELSEKLAKLESLAAKGGTVSVDKQGNAVRNKPKLRDIAQNGNNSQTASGKWKVISAVYSTGVFKPDVDYTYTYIDLPPDPESPTLDANLDISMEDPTDKWKPKQLIFGLFNSKGAPLLPLTKLDGIGPDGTRAPSPFFVADWILDTPKWKFRYSRTDQSQTTQWPVFGQPTYIWKRLPGEEQASKTQPSSGPLMPSWEIKEYKEGDENIINKQKAIPGDPVISGFDAAEETEYRSMFQDIAKIRFEKSDLSQQEKNDALNMIMQQVNAKAHLENVFLYGQATSSVYKKIEIPNFQKNNPFPDDMKKSFKPFKIYSEEASNDPTMKRLFGSESGQIWIDPESDYYMKVIRVDPTRTIEYQAPGQQAKVTGEIKSFVKNRTVFKLEDGRKFSVKVTKSINGTTNFNEFETSNNITEYVLENWNYNDDDGVLANTIRNENDAITLATNPPVLSNTNSYKISIWGETPTPLYVDKSYVAFKALTPIPPTTTANLAQNPEYVEVKKELGFYSYTRFRLKLDNKSDYPTFKFREKIETGQIEYALDTLYQKYLQNQTDVVSFDINPGLITDKSSKGHLYGYFLNKDNYLNSPGTATQSSKIIIAHQVIGSDNKVKKIEDVRYLFKYAKYIYLKKGGSNSNTEHRFSVKNSNDNSQYVAATTTDPKRTIVLIEPSTSTVKFDSSYFISKITFDIPLVEFFSEGKREKINVTGLIKLEEDGSIVEVENNKIVKWFYMTPSGISTKNGTDGYTNGDFSKNGVTKNFTTLGQLTQNNVGNFENKPLPENNVTRTLSINLVRNENNEKKGLIVGTGIRRPIITAIDNPLPVYQIKVQNSDGSFSVIDPSQITNEQLKTNKPFSNGKYGHGSEDDPQQIEVIKRFMRTEFDTESYYIIEGIRPDEVANLESPTFPPGGTKDDYRLPDAIGAIKVFILLLVDIFSQLFPTIQKLIKLFQNPPSFVSDIAIEKLQDNFTFLGKSAQETFKQAASLKQKIPSVSSKSNIKDKVSAGLPTNQTTPQVNIDKKQLSPAITSQSPEVNSIKKQVSELKDLVGTSELSNHVYVADDGKLISVFDGTANLPFSVFGNDLPAPVTGQGLPKSSLPFGLKLELGALPEKPPIKLLKPDQIKKSDFNTIDNKIKGTNLGEQDKPITASDLEKPDDKTYSSPNIDPSGQSGQLGPDETFIKFEDGSSVLLKNTLANEFIKNNSSRYNFIYVKEETAAKIKKADDLLELGTIESVTDAVDLYESAAKDEPDNNTIQEKLQDALNQKQRIESGQQPLLKLLLGFVTLPIKIISGIVEYILAFFKSLTNPLKLPSSMTSFLSFSWLVDLLKPTGLLSLAGIKFKPEKLPEWAALSFIPNPTNKEISKDLNLPTDITTKGFNPKKPDTGGYLFKDDFKIADMSEYMNAIFNVKLPQVSTLQNRQGPFLYMRTFGPTLCLLEKIINSIIDFIWSTLGIEAIKEPPHVKLCKKLEEPKSKDIQGNIINATEQLSAFDPQKANELFTGGGDADALEAFVYEVKLPNGETKRFLDRQKLDDFIQSNNQIDYEFNF